MKTAPSGLSWLWRLPELAGMALLVAVAVLIIASWSGLVAIDRHLVGVETAIRPPSFSWRGLWSGEYQRQFTAWFGRANPALPIAVRLKSQVYFTLLNQSAIPEVVIGRRLQLFEPYYIAEYCSRDPAAMTASADAWARKLELLQQWYAERGRLFIYLVTPSKAATYPRDIPAGWPCPASLAQREGLMPAWRAALKRRNVNFVDGTAVIAEAKAHYPFPLFPRGGIHWNWVGATLGMQAVVRQIDVTRPLALPDFDFVWRPSTPTFTDADLTDLLNLPFPRLDYPAPVVDLKMTGTYTCPAPDITEVGGSFLFQINELLARLPCAPRVDFYYYFKLEHVRYPGGTREPVDEQQRRSLLLDGSSIVLLEENEAEVYRSRHGAMLWDLISGRLGGQSADSR
jgi:alginate O-acetyltransferase complex protein AlgJ